MHDQSTIERAVMRRVHRIRILRPLFSGFTASCVLLAGALFGIGREVWVAHVFQNAPSDFIHLPNFYFAAFNHTRLVVQALTLVTLASLAYLAREIARSLSFIFLKLGHRVS